MRIKKKNLNEYLLTPEGVWVRDFTKKDAPYTDINRLTSPADYGLLLKNQIANQIVETARIDLEDIFHPDVVIVSDGYGFEEKHELLAKLPKDVCVITVNGALAKWKLFGQSSPDKARIINYFVVNNPYQEALTMLPKRHRYHPKCISSVRTNPEFLSLYKGIKYFYSPTNEEGYSSGKTEALYLVDDYRNPICAAIALAYRFGVQRLMLFCCDEAYTEQRPGTEKLECGLWSYPAQKTCHNLIDANLYWLANQKGMERKIGAFSSGPVYAHAAYIAEEDVSAFFKGD